MGLTHHIFDEKCSALGIRKKDERLFAEAYILSSIYNAGSISSRDKKLIKDIVNTGEGFESLGKKYGITGKQVARTAAHAISRVDDVDLGCAIKGHLATMESLEYRMELYKERSADKERLRECPRSGLLAKKIGVGSLNFPEKLVNALRAGKIYTLYDLQENRHRLCSIPGIGKNYRELIEGVIIGFEEKTEMS